MPDDVPPILGELALWLIEQASEGERPPPASKSKGESAYALIEPIFYEQQTGTREATTAARRGAYLEVQRKVAELVQKHYRR